MPGITARIVYVPKLDDFDTLRPLCYPQTNVFLLCFSVVCPTSFHNIQEKWLPEIRRHRHKAPIILVGTQCDLRHDVKVLIELAQCHEQPVNNEVAHRVANKIGAIKYVECSALTQKNLKDVFDTSILAGIEYEQQLLQKSNNKNTSNILESSTSSTCQTPTTGALHPQQLFCRHSSSKCNKKITNSSKNRLRKGWRRFCCGL
ncbi:unnamed protein product [Medioppia subpectinata]|uniref:Uncharacterized protein n=1 Tax=Medioppia subpectinata TaxID=1979941 RepID=A0A7R9KMJ3_9ACAR|nr:unnamed protein product [Medioppia subpectinata]CAG2105043.1 unnamed protein product [Medioppia subpectinata]